MPAPQVAWGSSALSSGKLERPADQMEKGPTMTVWSRLLLPLLFVCSLAAPAHALELVGTVVRVSDGDTIAVKVPNQRDLVKVRLLGIDAPEVKHSVKDPGQEPWGSRAQAFTRQLTLNKQVRILTDRQAHDQYGRLLGFVYVGPTFVNLELVKHGHAMVLTYAPNVSRHALFSQAQRQARAAGRGIWNPQQPLTESPHTYRHNGHRQGSGGIVAEAVQMENRVPAAHRDSRHAPRPSAAPLPTAHAESAQRAQPAAATAGTVLMHDRTRKYHEPGCRHATGSHMITVTRAEAEATGTPCWGCHKR
jgi:micrococcal nuclease